MTEYVEVLLDGNTQEFLEDNRNYKFKLGQSYSNVVGAKIVEAHVPFSWYVVTDDYIQEYECNANSIFIATNIVGPNPRYELFLQPGTYVPDQLCTALENLVADEQAAIDAVLGTTNIRLTCAYSSLTLKYSLRFEWDAPAIPGMKVFFSFRRNLSSVDLKVGQNALWMMLGMWGHEFSFVFPELSNLGCYQLSSLIAQTQGWQNILICSRFLGPLFKSYLTEGAYINNSGYENFVCAKLPVSSNFGQTFVYKDPNPDNFFTFPSVPTFSEFDLWVASPHQPQTPLSLNYVPISIKLALILQPHVAGTSLSGTLGVDRVKIYAG
jgi:hypothetical protein